MTATLEPRAMGRDIARRDGAVKVHGTAVYADDTPVTNPLYCRIVQSNVVRGRVRSVDASDATALAGVVRVLIPNGIPDGLEAGRAGVVVPAERLASTDDAELAVLQDAEVDFRGQIVAAVLAETDEIAREAADLVRVEYTAEEADVLLSADRDDLYTPEMVGPGYAADTAEGDMAAAMADAPVTVEQTYTTPMYHNNPMEPHATTALWQPSGQGGHLTLWDSTQGVHPVRTAVHPVFGLEPEQVRVICPYVGGGFGSKGPPHAHVVMAGIAARAVPGRPVKLALTRQQMFSLTGYRTPTIQRMQLAAARDGHLRGIALDVVEQTSRIKEFAEHAGIPARTMYAAPNRRSTHRLAALDVPVPGWMRAPGECPGMFGPEVAMDELAAELGMDPIELRIRNEPEVDPENGKPFSSRNLVACLREGAARFGWAGRDHRPRLRLEDGWWVGTGVAASFYPTLRNPTSTATVMYDGGRYVARIGAADLGTGAWTVLPQITADALGVPVEDVDVLIGDTDHPEASWAGGSAGTSTWGSALVDAARQFRAKFGTDPADGDEAEGAVTPNPAEERYSMAAFGAQFAEVRVHADTGEVRVPRLHGVFAAGRILNPRLVRSQFLGGMTMGLGMALHEHSVFDPRTGHVVNHDLAEYHVPANADVEDLQAHWIDEHDPHVNAMGSKGIGEIGIVGTAAAVANAAWHATGVRVRDLPVTLEKVLPLP